METFNIEDRWPELFEGLDNKQRRAVIQSLAAGWHEGHFPTREVVKNLTSFVRGEINFVQYSDRVQGRNRNSI